MKADTEKKAILAVSFGTSVSKTRERTIDCIEADLDEAFPDYRIYRAWTSKIIIAKLLRRDGIRILSVKEAMEQMQLDGITHDCSADSSGKRHRERAYEGGCTS